MDIELVTFDDGGDLRTLCSVDWPAIPRKGDLLALRGEKYGEGEENEKEARFGSTTFEVLDVEWVMTADDPSEPEIRIVLALPAESRSFVPLCTCPAEDMIPKERDPNRCDNCNGALGRRHFRRLEERKSA